MERTETKPEELVIPEGPESLESRDAPTSRAPARAEAAEAARRERAPRGPMMDGMGNGRPSDPESMRLEIERTRERMSGTLDALEDRLVRRKRELWAKATLQDFRSTVTREPWRSMAIAFVVGYVVAAIRD